MQFKAPFIHHAQNAQKLQKLATYATGAAIFIGIISFFTVGEATNSTAAAITTAAIIIIGSLLAGGVAHAIFAIMEITAKMANEDARRVHLKNQENSQ